MIEWPHRQLLALLFIGASALKAADAVGLVGTPPIVIEVHAESITAFDNIILHANALVSSNIAVA